MPPPLRTAALPDVLSFMQGLWAVVHRMERLSKQMGAATGVTGPQRLVLRLLGLFPGLSAGDLATALHLHPSTLTGVLKRLEAQGLVARSTDPGDRRRTVLVLTRQGRQASRQAHGTVEAAVASALEHAPAAHRVAAHRLLARLADALDQELARAS
jgi:MarR family transcriptional regulator, organic hydroperoxide resistance regulator